MSTIIRSRRRPRQHFPQSSLVAFGAEINSFCALGNQAAHLCAACIRVNFVDQPSAFFTRSGDIGVSRSRTPVSSATALAMAGATSGVAI